MAPTAFPGYHWLVSPWDDGLWHWTAYRRLAVDGEVAVREHGAERTRDAALAAARAAVA